MTSKNGLLITRSCVDCHLKILSDKPLEVLGSFDWQSLRFLERYKGRGRRCEYSVIAFLRALIYMELAGITSVRKLVRLLEHDKYKLMILGFHKLPDHSLFSRYKQRFGEHIPRIMTILNTSIRELEPLYGTLLGIDSTKIHSYGYDIDAAWGYDHIEHRYFYGYRASILHDLDTLTPICYTVTPANKHDNTQVTPLLKKHGTSLLHANIILADKAYDTKENIEKLLGVNVLFITARNKRNSKKQENKYRIQDYTKIKTQTLDQLYKCRMDCEHVNFLLKEHLPLTNIKTKGIKKVRTKIGITLITRQIQVHHQLKRDKNPRTTTMN